MDKIRKFISDLRTYDEGCEPADGWYVAYDDLQKSANTMEAMLKVVEAAENVLKNKAYYNVFNTKPVENLQQALANLKGEGE